MENDEYLARLDETKEGFHALFTAAVEPPRQLNLAQCIERIEKAINHDDRRNLEKYATLDDYRENFAFGSYILHHQFGQWVRNYCDLWKYGCNEVVADLLRLKAAGVEFDMRDLNTSNDPDNGELFAYSIYHPDNCSGIIVELYHRIIRGDLGLSLIERR